MLEVLLPVLAESGDGSKVFFDGGALLGLG